MSLSPGLITLILWCAALVTFVMAALLLVIRHTASVNSRTFDIVVGVFAAITVTLILLSKGDLWTM